MTKQLLIFFYLISLYISTYRPMSKKNIDFNLDNVCYYQDISDKSFFEYVRPCESEKSCILVDDYYDPTNPTSSSPNYPSYNVKTCQDYFNYFRTMGDDCTTNEDCDGTLVCSSGKKCTFDGNKYYYKNNHYYCPSNKYYNSATSVDGTCNEDIAEANRDKCLVQTKESGAVSSIIPTGSNNYEPGYFKMCGYISLDVLNNNNNYYKKYVSISEFCSVQDGEFVEDKFACKSGFALYFYANKKYKKSDNPYTSNPELNVDRKPQEMFLRCVTVTGIDTDNQIIKYKIENGEEEYYHFSEVHSNYQNRINYDGYTMTKLELFQKYKERYNAIKSDCMNYLYPEEPATCRDNELRKWYYFYRNPEKYLLYRNEPQVMDYLVQKTYPTYTSNSSRFLNLSILSLLLIFISF